MKTIIAVLILLISGFGLVHAKMYKWVDKNGVTHFSNIAPPTGHDQVETQKETKSHVTTPSSSPGIQRVLNSYKKDEIEYKLDQLQKQTRDSSGKNKDLADYYSHRIKEEKARVKSRQQDLEDAKRESYSDSMAKKKKIRFYKEQLENAELDLERVEAKYKKYKYGQ